MGQRDTSLKMGQGVSVGSADGHLKPTQDLPLSCTSCALIPLSIAGAPKQVNAEGQHPTPHRDCPMPPVSLGLPTFNMAFWGE